ncbi:MAG: NAD(P)-dependent dehydrogenase (short-subunit alcohol dehydrogenase family) [Acidimicrobiales bacterium]|jgi:NAD(P)-dependent dehydrogenase (short-subunit alcohol dehydrogenase family)
MSSPGKHILITGAGSGFGRGAALALAERGHHVIGGCINTGEAADLAATHENIDGRKLDITDMADVASVADLQVDVLLNNAGRGQLGPLADVPMDLVRQVFEVNVFGTMQITQAVLAGMKQRKSGRVITVSSIAGLSSGALSGPYAMTKHALEAFCKSLRIEMEPYGIEVCKLNPGPYATGFNDAMVDGVDEQLAPAADVTELELAAGTRTRMLGNQLDPQEVVDAMVHLCTAATVPFETFKPDNILERYGITR